MSSSFSTSNVVDFIIPKSVEVLQHLDLMLSFANASGSAWAPAKLGPYYWLSRVEIYQKEMIQTILPEEFRDHYIFSNNKLTDRQIKASAYGVNASTYVTNVSITDATTGTYNIRIPSVLNGEYMENLDEVRIRFVLANIADVSSDTNTSVTVSSAKLRITDIQVDEATKQQLRAENASSHDKRVCLPTNELQTVSLSTSNTKVVLRNFNHHPYVAFATVEVCDLSSNQYNRETMLALTSISRSLENQSGVLIDGITWTDAELRGYLAPKTFEDNSVFSESTYHKYIYILPGACLDGKTALTDGVHSGGIAYEPNMRLNLVAPSSYSNHTLLVRLYEWKHVRIQNGMIKIY